MVTETLIRGMYEYWRKVMEAPEDGPPRSPTACGSLPPEGAQPSLGAARREDSAPEVKP